MNYLSASLVEIQSGGVGPGSPSPRNTNQFANDQIGQTLLILLQCREQ